jgi:hypothetical protein
VNNIQISPEERAAGALEPDRVDAVRRALVDDGYAILADLIEPAVLDALKPRLDEDTQRLLDLGRWGGAGRVPGHLQQSMPRETPWIFRDIVANPIVIQATHSVLGNGLHNHFYNGNTNTPGSGEQPLHRDRGHLWPGVAHPPASLVVNISPVAVDEANGSTEIWPGTHRLPAPQGQVDDATAAERRASVPPVRANTTKGSVVIRDIRLWHRGMPNHADASRHMISMVHSAAWFRPTQRIRVVRGCEQEFASELLDPNLEIVDDPFDYLLEPFVSP